MFEIIQHHAGEIVEEVVKEVLEVLNQSRPLKRSKIDGASTPMATIKTEDVEEPKQRKAEVNDTVTNAGRAAPRGPKKPMGAYMWFCQSKRGELKEAHPEWKVADIGRECGTQWRQLTDKEKKKFEWQAAEDKARYEEEMKAYMLTMYPE